MPGRSLNWREICKIGPWIESSGSPAVIGEGWDIASQLESGKILSVDQWHTDYDQINRILNILLGL